MYLVLIILFVTCTTCAYVGDSLNFLSRVYGALVNRYEVFTHIGMLVQLINRAAFAFAMPLLGYFVDSQLGLDSLFTIYYLSLAILGLVLFVAYQRMNIAFYFIRLVGRAVHNEQSEMPDVHPPPARYLDRAATASMVFYLLGFMGPAMVAMSIPDYRATLLQFGFVFNSLGTLINVLLIEKRFSSLAQNSDRAEITSYARVVIYSRFVAVVIVAGFFLLLNVGLRIY
jgi:hypothetical protein